LPVDHHPHVPLARHDIDPLVRVARVLENLLIFLHPLVHLRPIKRVMTLEARGFCERCCITPYGVFGAFVAHLHRPEAGFAFDFTPGFVSTRHKEIRAYVFFRKIIGGQDFRLA
jgi:hypothetical protein